MYQIWAYDTQQEEWIRVSQDFTTWEETLNWARNRALKDIEWNVSIHEFDKDGEIVDRHLLEEIEYQRKEVKKDDIQCF